MTTYIIMYLLLGFKGQLGKKECMAKEHIISVEMNSNFYYSNSCEQSNRIFNYPLS